MMFFRVTGHLLKQETQLMSLFFSEGESPVLGRFFLILKLLNFLFMTLYTATQTVPASGELKYLFLLELNSASLAGG